MIIWLASYPKSGNTLLRSMLSAYFFSKDGMYDFPLIKKIKQFPHGGLFKKLGIDITNEKEVIDNYINVQNAIINKSQSIKFFKTHSFLFKEFTSLENTLGVIYIVRDPRNVILSFSKFMSLSMEETLEFMIKGQGNGAVWTGNWSKNFQSWKQFSNYNRYLLIKYEDLISNREQTFLKILRFIHNLSKSKFSVDQDKFKNTIKTTDFNYLKNLEKTKGFSEARINPSTGKTVPFFDKGGDRNWQEELSDKIRKKLEITFKDEMTELGYL